MIQNADNVVRMSISFDSFDKGFDEEISRLRILHAEKHFKLRTLNPGCFYEEHFAMPTAGFAADVKPKTAVLRTVEVVEGRSSLQRVYITHFGRLLLLLRARHKNCG